MIIMEGKRKKILYLITKSNWGGAQKYVYDLVTNISKDKFETVVALGGNGELKDKLELAGIPVISIKNLERDVNPLKDTLALKRLFEIIKKEKPDILHINSSKIGGLGSFAGRIAKVPFILFTAHGWAWNEDRPIWQNKTIKELQWLTILLSHKTIAVSEALVKQVSKFPLISKKIVKIYTGIVEPLFLPRDESRKFFIEKNSRLTNSSTWIGTVAELHKNKGYIHTLKALKTLKIQGFLEKSKIQYIIIGEGEERKRLENLVIEYEIQDYVFFVGKIENAAKYLKALDLFILTSNTEALGYVLVEAGMARVPIIASLVGGIPEVIEDMKSGILVHNKNQKEVAIAIQYILEHKDKQKEFTDALYKKTRDIFSIAKMIQETEKLYLEK